eukprot:4897985-Amphidinium_carterae.1
MNEAAKKHETSLIRKLHMIQQQLHAKDRDRVQEMEGIRRKYVSELQQEKRRAERTTNLEIQGNQGNQLRQKLHNTQQSFLELGFKVRCSSTQAKIGSKKDGNRVTETKNFAYEDRVTHVSHENARYAETQSQLLEIMEVFKTWSRMNFRELEMMVVGNEQLWKERGMNYGINL